MRFGAGRIDELADACKSLKIVRPLIITDNFIGKLPFTQKALMILKAAEVLGAHLQEVEVMVQVEVKGHLTSMKL